MRDGGKVGIPEAGFIAQELDAVQQQFTATDYLNLIASNEDGSRLEATPGRLLPVLVQAVKELADANDALTASNADLIARVIALESK